jgi:hypothetical protein
VFSEAKSNAQLRHKTSSCEVVTVIALSILRNKAKWDGRGARQALESTDYVRIRRWAQIVSMSFKMTKWQRISVKKMPGVFQIDTALISVVISHLFSICSAKARSWRSQSSRPTSWILPTLFQPDTAQGNATQKLKSPETTTSLGSQVSWTWRISGAAPVPRSRTTIVVTRPLFG